MIGNAAQFTGRNVLITGGSSGIGNGIARGLFESGANVTIMSRRPPHRWECPMPAEWPEQRNWLHADFFDLEQALATVDRWLQNEGRDLDVFVHSAVTYGATSRRPLMEIALEEWDRVFKVGPRAYFAITKALLPVLLARPSGLIVSISSEVAHHAGPGRADYAASKAASHSISMSIAEELQHTNVRVVELLPEGMVDTPGIRSRRQPGADLSGYASPDSFIGPVRALVANMGVGLNKRGFVVTGEGEMVPLESVALRSQSNDAEAHLVASYQRHR